MDDKTYLTHLKESSGVPLQEAVPWRMGTIKLEKGKTAVEGLRHDCLVLNDLKFVFTMNPSFMFVIPKINLLYKDGGGTNGFIITARKAQQLEYQVTETGTCYAKAYFFGREKPGRFFDLYQRVFEKGFSIQDIKGIKGFPAGAILSATVQRKDFRTTGMITGKQYGSDLFKIPARFRTSIGE